jgi:beta-lactam-binding protein with PASTA domain
MDRDRVVEADFFSTIPPMPLCHVPRVVGMLRSKAVTKIKRAHCRLGRLNLRRSSTARRNHVLAQSPRPGRKLPPGGRVNLIVGKGPTRT